MQPSEIAGVGCEFCAYLFDDALLHIEVCLAQRDEDDRKAEENRARALESARAGKPVG